MLPPSFLPSQSCLPFPHYFFEGLIYSCLPHCLTTYSSLQSGSSFCSHQSIEIVSSNVKALPICWFWWLSPSAFPYWPLCHLSCGPFSASEFIIFFWFFFLSRYIFSKYLFSLSLSSNISIFFSFWGFVFNFLIFFLLWHFPHFSNPDLSNSRSKSLTTW